MSYDYLATSFPRNPSRGKTRMGVLELQARSRLLRSATLSRSRDLRRNMTDAERKLWLTFRRRTLGVRFRRQFPVGTYIVDFCCLKPKLVVEIDGGQHVRQSEYDERRTRFLESQGFSVLRLWNNEVLANPEAVLELIQQALTRAGSSTPILAFPREGCGRRE